MARRSVSGGSASGGVPFGVHRERDGAGGDRRHRPQREHLGVQFLHELAVAVPAAAVAAAVVAAMTGAMSVVRLKIRERGRSLLALPYLCKHRGKSFLVRGPGHLEVVGRLLLTRLGRSSREHHLFRRRLGDRVGDGCLVDESVSAVRNASRRGALYVTSPV